LVRKYPDRYLSGFCRTLLFFAGFNGAESDNRIYRDQVFSPTLTGSKVSDGPEPLQTRIKEEFHQNTTVSILLSLMRRLAAPYDMLVIAGSFITVLGLGAGLLLRDRDLLTACSIAVLYPFSYALFLVSIDRFALPVQPLFLCNLLLVPTLLFRRRRAREQVATASASHLTKASPR
jgi:hypothetical protein